MKQDRRSKRTRLWLYEGLMELMKSKDYGDISITELTEKSDIARQSFYRIYDSKDDILLSKMNDIHREIFDESELDLEQEKDPFLDIVIHKLVKAFEENEVFFTALLNAGLQHKALTQFSEYIGRFYAKEKNYQELDERNQYRIHFIVGGIYMVLFKWNECNMDTPTETIITIMQKSAKHINLIIEEHSI
ncbi:TetR/AcrR family transcriptional regulator [Vallitalea pronyensis]|uniref:TetR/AcrR family transcriptional regulator n=1 Tax=Vallitalea pronyensis TaxID=1348613 RepID=A0A8J8MP48_9FIRM|nr:TetR/AcrR family transcriptional regulator [Vallitalea pronyensis]QUI25335.1 TetR/AcrR family transcriptional regulator [Vallitalea pronyensis]